MILRPRRSDAQIRYRPRGDTSSSRWRDGHDRPPSKAAARPPRPLQARRRLSHKPPATGSEHNRQFGRCRVRPSRGRRGRRRTDSTSEESAALLLAHKKTHPTGFVRQPRRGAVTGSRPRVGGAPSRGVGRRSARLVVSAKSSLATASETAARSRMESYVNRRWAVAPRRERREAPRSLPVCALRCPFRAPHSTALLGLSFGR